MISSQNRAQALQGRVPRLLNTMFQRCSNLDTVLGVDYLILKEDLFIGAAQVVGHHNVALELHSRANSLYLVV